MKKVFMLCLIGCVMLAGCEQSVSWWEGPAKEEKIIAARPAVQSPCGAPLVSKVEQSYPIGDAGGNAVRLEKMVPAEIRADEQFDYRIKVTNLTDRKLINVAVTDSVPENLRFESSTPKIRRIGTGVRWMLGDLGPKESKIINAVAVVDGEGTLISCAEVFYDSPVCAKIAIVEPKLKLTKVVPSESLMCDRIPFKYIITNEGTGYACDIEIKEALPEDLFAGQSREILFKLDALAPGASKEFEIMVDAKRAGMYASKAIAISRTSGTVESNMPEMLISQPILAISNSGPERRYLGRTVKYDIMVVNRGDGTAKDTVVELKVPEDVEFERATAAGRFSRSSPGKVIWNLGALAPNASRRVSAVFTTTRPGILKVEAMTKAYCAEMVSASAETMLSGIPAILLEVIDVSDPIEVGQNTVYIIKVTNQGSAPATNIQISCMMEDEMEYVSSSGPTRAIVEGRKITFAPLASLAAKAEAASWQVKIKALDQGDTRFKVMLNSNELDRVVQETEATRFYKY